MELYPHKITWDGQTPIARKEDAESVILEENEPLRAECKHFLECVSERISPRTDGEEGLRVLKVLNASQKSMESGQGISMLGNKSDYFVHESSVIDNDVAIGSNTKIWHFSHVLSGSNIGERCNIGQNVVIGPEVSVGARCKIQNNVSIYKGVTLKDDVFCDPSIVFTNVHNPRSSVERKDEYRTTLVKRGCSIGANATIVCGITLGEHSFIGAGAVVTKDVLAHALVLGNPGKQVGWMSKRGHRLGSDLKCPEGGEQYIETDEGLQEIAS